jgi:hypothetical protein
VEHPHQRLANSYRVYYFRTRNPQGCGSGRKKASTERTHAEIEYGNDNGEEGKRTEKVTEEENEK